ncbi:MAG TPA: ATP-binding protein [Dongiaceae bacterium]|nr:ATP-binding protein [Dongiaceae bacterium]
MRIDFRAHPAMPYVWAAGAIAVAAVLSWALRGFIADESLSMVFLSAVLVSCIMHGRKVGIMSALFAFLAYNVLFLEPRFSFRFAPLSDTLTLAVFLAVALLTGGLAGRVRDQAKAKAARAATMTTLFNASHALGKSADRSELVGILAEQVAQATAEPAHIFLRNGDGVTWAASSPAAAENPAPEIIGFAERAWTEIWAAGNSARIAPSGAGLAAHPLGTISKPMGLLIWRRPFNGDGGNLDDQTIAVLCELGAIALERAYLMEEMTKAQVLVEADRLRTALLSSISHDFRTPLAGILASATALIEQGEHFPPAAAAELLADIRDQAERMNRYVANLLEMIKLESGAVTPRLEPTEIVDIIGAAGRRLAADGGEGAERGWLRRAIPAESCLVEADPVLLEQAIYNVLDNAMLYSAPDASVEISVHGSLHVAEIVITDEGPGIPQEDLERVFDKFYRVSGSGAQVQGTGLGLSICRGLVEAMNGTVRAVSPVKDEHGTAIHISLKRIGGG